MIGVYETGIGIGQGNDLDPMPMDQDNDPDPEYQIPGATFIEEPECSIVGYEQIRDASEQHNVNSMQYYATTTAHEIGHQFELEHSDPTPEPEDLMWIARNDGQEALAAQRPWRWKTEDIVTIRWMEKP